jgi:hypothetical protein
MRTTGQRSAGERITASTSSLASAALQTVYFDRENIDLF